MPDLVDKLYDNLKEDGWVENSRENFRNYFLAPGKQGYMNRKALYDNMKEDGYVDSPTYEEFAQRMGLIAGKPERVDQPVYQPTAGEMAGFQSTINSAGRAAANPTQSYDRKAELMKKRQGLNVPQQVNLGESNNLTPTEQRFNPETGEMEQGYMTGAGNEYGNKAIADMEQRQIDQAQRDEKHLQSLPGQLDDAYAERDRLNAELAKFKGEWVDQDGRVHYGNRGDDESVASLESALRQNQQRITALEAERDDGGFWRGFIDAAKNPSVQSFGMTDFDDMLQLMRIKSKIDNAKATGQQPQLSPAEQQLMESSYLNNYAQSAYGDNRGFMYRAGGISMQALPFVTEFMMTGGFSALSAKGAELGAKAAEKLALEGLKKTVVKNLGVLAGDVAAGWAMANTTGLFRTAGDVMQRNIGQVAVDDEGNFGFEGGKSLGRSIYEAEVANTLEYYTEKLGEHLKLGKRFAKVADKYGLSKLSKAVNYLSNSKWLERGGIQDYPSEVIEEQANLLLNGLLVGDNNFSVDPNSEKWDKSVFNPKTQADIWGGMMLSIGLMQTPRLAATGYNAAGYYAFKKNVDVSDANAAIVFGRDNWDMIKEQIDNCDNEQMSALLESVVNGKMSPEQKTATMNYAGNLLKMRGYNMGMMADTKDEENTDPQEAAVSRNLNQNYMAGHQTQMPDEMKAFVDEANAAEQQLPQYGQEFAKLVTESQNPVETLNYLMNNRNYFTDDQIGAAADYFQKQARAEGIMDGALDNVDLQVERANAEVRGNTHQQTGSIIMAKGADDMDYYIIGGDVVTDPDTGTMSLAGTGGAVVVKDPITGEVSVKSPQEVIPYSMQDANELIEQNETVLRQQLMKQAEDNVTYGSPASEVYDLEDTVTLQDGNGGVIEGQIVSLPNSVDGVFVVQTNDGKALQMTADDMNRRIVAHNGAEVQRAQQQNQEEIPLENPRSFPEASPNSPQNAQNPEQSGTLDNATGEESLSGTTEEGDSTQPQSALSRIPIRMDDKGQPVKNKKGRPVLDWHKASTEDAAAALIETTGGNMVMARDTASDLVRQAQERKDKIAKQKPKGDDPIEIAESRLEIQRQIEEQQAIIKQWQDVGTNIRKQMESAEAERRAAEEAAKSEEQRQRETEEARIRKEKQDEIDRQRLREQIEKDKIRRNKEYEPVTKAREELANDKEALAILDDTEPRDLDEWVSSLLRPHSMLWQDASESEVGLQSELGLKRADMQRMMTLLGTKESGAKPFGQVVLDIHEGLPDAMKEQYTDEDVRNALLGLFNEGSSTRMMHLTEDRRIEEARQLAKENERRDREAELDAWAEAYHLTPGERDTFESFMKHEPYYPEEEIIHQIILENEERQSVRGTELDSNAGSRGNATESETGEGQVQQAAETAGNGNNEQGTSQGEETAAGQPPVSDNDVFGRKYIDLRANLKYFVEETGIAEGRLIDDISNYEVDQLMMMIEDWETEVKENGSADELFEPIHQYVEGLKVKYAQTYKEGVMPTPEIDNPRYKAIRQALIDAYASKDADAIAKAAEDIRQYVDEGLDSNGEYREEIDDYEGDDPTMLADQYLIHVFQDRYLDYDDDQDYIRTGLRADLRNSDFASRKPEVSPEETPTLQAGNSQGRNQKSPIAPSEQLKPTDLRDAVRPESAELGVSEANARARALTKEEAEALIQRMEASATKDPQISLTPETWAQTFGLNNSLETPIGNVKMGEGQYQKFFDKSRSKEFGMAVETLKDPDVVMIEPSQAKEGQTTERPYSYIFVKTFDRNGENVKYYASVTVQRDNMEVSVSSHYMKPAKVLERLTTLERLYTKETLLPNSSEWHLAEQQNAVPDLLPTQENNVTSEDKGTNNSPNNQEKSEKSAKYSSFDELVADTEVNVVDSGMKRALRKIVDKIFSHGSSNTSKDPRGFDYRYVMLVDGTNKSDRELLKPWYSSSEIEYNDDNPAATWVDEEEQRIYFIKFQPSWKIPSSNFIIVGYKSMSQPIGKTSSPEEIAEEEAKVDTNPTEAQKEAGNYQKGHINVDGYDITIENPKGSVRSGVDSKGNRWETTMRNTYGYIRGTEGVDGDHIDVFLSDNPTSGSVFVVDQVNPESGAFDEHKVMYGFASEEEARKAYLANYSEGWQGLGAITEVSREEFKKWVESSHRKTKPFAEYKTVKKEQPKPKKQHKRIVSDDKMEELRKQLLAKFNTLNEGIDVERMLLGAMYAVGKIERGVTKFADYAAQMVDEIGDAIRPYLKAFYEAVRNMPEAAEYRDQMTSPEEVAAFDEYNFDKQQKTPDAITKAEQVVKKQKAKQQVKKIEKEVKQKIQHGDLFAGDLFGEQPQQKVSIKKEKPIANVGDVFNNKLHFDSQGNVGAINVIVDIDDSGDTRWYVYDLYKNEEARKKGEKFVTAKIREQDLQAALDTREWNRAKQEKPKLKTAWWNDPNRPQSLDPSDYKTYMTDEAKEYFANFKSEDGKTDFTKWAHPNLAYITAAAWDGANIPVKELMQVPEIIEAEQRIRSKKGSLNINEEEQQQHVSHLLDDKHGSAVYENGKIKKVNDVPQFTGPVRQERKAFIVIGLPAGGKSSVFANPLSNEHGARIIDSDVVKPWLSGYDEGYGAGYVQTASAKVADQAIMEAAKRGDNMVIPRIGGNSLIPQVVIPLREMGYDVQLFWNDVSEESSIMRAASRFAEEGRYLSLGFLTKSERKDSKTFSTFAEKKLGDYYAELEQQEAADSGHSVSPSGRVSDVLADRGSNSGGRESSRSGAGTGIRQVVQGAGEREESERGGKEVPRGELIFSYAEWKSNDVAFGEKPKEIWNSKSGKPMPEKEKESNSNKDELHSVRSGQRVSAESLPSGEGAEQAGGAADRAGAEPSPEQNRAERSGRERSVEHTLGVPDEGEETRDSSGGPQRRSDNNASVGVRALPKNNNRRNNVGERGHDYAPTSPKARFNANVEAIKLMRQLMDEGVEAPTKEQMEVLRQYSGWGGLGTYFNDETTAENRTLRDLLDEEEYNDAVMSINSAYFTPANVIDTLWDIAEAMGFEGGNVLEGSAGIGNIIGQMPKKMSSQSNIEAVEIDKISGNILKLLYPDAKVHIAGFQDVKIPNGSVDLAITNVPFVTGLHVFDEVDKDLSRKFKNIHDFCIAKNIRKLREGGIGLFITSSGTLDKSTDLRSWITDEGSADVVGAFRLNNETFGGTNVTSDIIVVRKRMNGVESNNAIDVKQASPIRVGSYTDKFEKEHQTSMTVNDYFHNHPEMMAGEMFFGYEKGDTFRPGSYGLYPVEGKSQEKMMQDFVKTMAKAKETPTQSKAKEETAESNQLTAVKEGRMLIDDNGRLCISRMGTAVPLGVNDQKVKGYTKQQCFKDYQDVQKAVDDVLQQQLNDPDDAHLEPKLKALNAAYDKFVKRYGTLHKNTSISFLRNDIDFPSFQALENYSETKDMSGKVTVKTSKAPLFTQRVLGFKTEPQPKSVKDAVIASIFRSNGIDLEWIANKLSEVAAPPNGENWTVDDVRKGILVSRLGFENPATGQLEIRYKYLSGNVREKLAMAEAYNTDGKYSSNVEELRKVVPMDIPSHLIDFSLGSSWIPIELYKQYLEENYDLSNVKLSHVEGNWVLDEGYSFRNEKNRVAGVYSEQFRETIYGHQLVAAALNNRPYKVSKQVSEGWGSSKTTKTVVDKDATQACAVRVDEIKDEFKQWAKKKMQDDPELGARIEKIYNEKFNALVPMEIGDEFLPEHFDGASTGITLRPHQKRGVIRDLSAPTMLAHGVGTGKSFTLITTAMEMRRLGTARKPMIVVQNATVAQMTSDVKLLYPNAKVLSLTEKDRDAEGRRAFYAKIKYNDWDIIIIPQSTFERIPDSPERELQFIQEKIDEKKHVIEAAMQSGMDSREIQRLKKELDKLEDEYGDKYLDNDPVNSSTPKKGKKKDAKKEAASLEKAKTKAQEQLDRATDDVQYFDDLGVDALLVDEAHEYKHLGFQTSIGRGIKGIDPSYSKKCAGLYNKTRSVFEKAGWKNVVFATGTPISNTAAEIWTFMKYLMPADQMLANDIYYFDDFVHNFGAISQMLEFATSGKFKENTRFAAYVNKPELIRIWSQVADTVLTKDAEGVKDKLPQKEGGKDQDVFLPQSPSLISIMAAVRAELERFENMTGQEKKENSSIPLTMYGIAKRAAIDPRLVNPDAADEPMSKTNAAVKEIVKDLKETAKYKGTVAVFCDNQNRKGADGSVEFNIYEDMKQKLIEAGVPADQIAIIKSGMSITAKQKVFDAVNDGSIRVVLGSTQTLGTGVNMQERLHLLIHMDAPDRPMDYTQRNGRIERQGNLHKDWDKPIRIVRFGVEDSLDVTAYQRLKTKSGFINSIMDGKAALANNQVDRTVEEEEEGLFDNPVAVLSGSQYALKKNQAERELRKYQGKKAQWEADQVYVANQLRRNKSKVEATEANIKTEEEQLANIRKLFPDGKVKTITVEVTAIDMTKDDGEKKLNEAIKEKINDPVNAIVKRNRENAIYNDETLNYNIKLDGHDVNFVVQVLRESVYNQGRMRTVIHKYISYASPDLRIESTAGSTSVRENLENILDEVVTGRDYEDRIEAYKAKINRINAETEQLQQRVGMEFQFTKELEQARKNVDEYTELMKKEMEEKEAKYAAQQKEAKEKGGFDLSKAEDNEDENDVRYSAEEDRDEPEQGQPMFRGVDEFAEGQQFPIRKIAADSSYNVLGRSYKYSSDLLPDEFATPQALLDAVRNAYPAYYAAIEADSIVLRSWHTVMAEARNARTAKEVKGTESYVERKTRQAIDAITDMANRMGLDVEVLTTTDGLTGKKSRSKGWFNPKTHKIAIVLPNHTNKDDVIGTLLHEGVAHYGLRKMFGQNFDTFLDNVYNNVSPEIKARIDAAIRRNGWSRHEATEEYLARLAEHTDFKRAFDSGWWQKIKNFFLEMLSKAGFDTLLTDNELRYILWRSYDHLLHPDNRRNIFDTAKEIQMQTRLKVGDYAEQIRIQRTGMVDTSPMVAAELLNRTDYASYEINNIVDKAKADGTYMKAPNGKPSNLNELQWAQVRTKAFKNWFGDWENDPENASKVVDENGEPKVMYHNTNLNWVNKGEPFWIFYEDSHFGTKGQAEDRMPSEGEGVKTYEVFLNIRNPQRRNDADQYYLDEKDMTMSEYWQQSAERSKGQGYDGIVYLNEYEDKEHPADSWIAFNPNQVKSATDNSGDFSTEDNDIRYSIRTKEPPKKTGKGYKVFVLKDGQLYPPMVANPNGEGTPVGVWLDADAAPIAGESKTGRPQVKAGGKGTQGGSGQLAYRPGWHLGTIPYALQFNRKDANGERTLFPNNFVWAEVEYADDVDYQQEAHDEGVNANGKYQHSLAGLKHVPTDGSYRYRTNPDPKTDEWVITGAMRVNKILSREEVDELVRKAGREPQEIQDGDILTQEEVDKLNAEIQATKEADEMGLLYSDDNDWTDDVAQEMYEKAVAKDSMKFQEAWQDSMVGLKAIQDAIAAETGRKATGAEDAYRFENRMHGRAKNMTEQYDWRFYRPMLKAFSDFIKKGNLTQKDGLDYMISKSGLERNVYYAMRDGLKAKVADETNQKREELDKKYARGVISEADYLVEKANLANNEAKAVDDYIQQIRDMYAYQHAKSEYDKGNISYSEYIRILETVIRDNMKRKTPKKDADGHVVSDNYYDDFATDYSGLTETIVKDMYDAAQKVKKQAQREIDPKQRKALWKEYDKQMRQAYGVARQVAEDMVYSVEGTTDDTRQPAQQLWDKINAATKETLKTSYESGLIDRNGYNKVRAMFDYYIPLRGWEEDKASDVYTYMGRDNVFSPAVKKTWGRKSKAENPLAYIGNIAVSTILSGHRNQMKQHFLNYVMNNPTSLVSISESWYENIAPESEAPVWILRTADTAGKSPDEIAQIVNDFNEEMQQKQRDGKAMPVKGRLRLDVNATKGQKAEHVVEVQRAGHTYQLYINGNPKAAQALNGTLGKATRLRDIPHVGKFVSGMNHSMAAFFTSKNPAFVISNLSRDLNMAGASVAIKEDKKYNAKFIANVAKVLAPRLGESSKWIPSKLQPTGLMPSLMRKYKNGTLDMTDETERLFKEFMDEGGETGFVNMLSVDSFKEKMQKEISQMNGSDFFGRGVKETTINKGLRLMGETFEFYNRCAEDATRFIVYMTSRQTGRSLEDSIADAKDVTLNFNRKGTGEGWIGLIQDLFVFVNPAIQALANMYFMMKKKPLRFGAVTGAFVAGGILVPVINQWLMNMFGDDDDKEAYWNLPPWVRKNNLVMWIPFTDDFITIPLAQEFRVFYGIGEMVGSYAYGHPHQNAGLEIVESLADLIPINPTGNGGNLIIDFMPTLTQPIMQIAFNTDFTGKPIWKDSQGNKYQPMASKAYVSTPKAMVRISEAINSITGGDEDMRGWLESTKVGAYLNNPAIWNHLLQGYLGGMYNTISKAVDTGYSLLAQGEMPEVYRMPVINRFLNRPSERETSSTLGEDYWELIEGNDEFQNILKKRKDKAKAGDEEAKKKLERMMQSEDYHRSLVISSYEKMIDEARKIEKSSEGDKQKEYRQITIELREALMEDLAAIDGGIDPVGLAIEKFDGSEDPRRRKAMASRISKEAGASQDPYGDKPKSDHAYQYQLQRNGKDVWEDALLLAYQEQLRDDGKEDEKKTLSNERTKVHYPGGVNDPLFKLRGAKSDRVIMENIRRQRKMLLDKYGLNKPIPEAASKEK